MPDFRMDCPARMASLTHEHCCFLAKDHGGRHACYCGVWWSEEHLAAPRCTPTPEYHPHHCVLGHPSAARGRVGMRRRHVALRGLTHSREPRCAAPREAPVQTLDSRKLDSAMSNSLNG